MRAIITRVLLPVAAGLAIVATAAVPAFAAGPAPVSNVITASGQVATSLTASWSSSTVNFGTLNGPGMETSAAGPSVSISTNDGLGFTDTLTPGGGFFDQTGAQKLPNSDLTISGSVSGTDSGAINANTFSGASPVTVFSNAHASSDVLAETWNISIPPSAVIPAESFSETFTDTVSAN